MSSQGQTLEALAHSQPKHDPFDATMNDGPEEVMNATCSLNLQMRRGLASTQIEYLVSTLCIEDTEESRKDLQAKAACFARLGGVSAVMQSVCSRKPESEEPPAGVGKYLALLPADTVCFACQDGGARSQVGARVASDLSNLERVAQPTNPGFFVAPPHGAEQGFDPYRAYTGLTSDSFVGYLHYAPAEASDMVHALGRADMPRAGEEIASTLRTKDGSLLHDHLNPHRADEEDLARCERHRQLMRAAMDKSYFTPSHQRVRPDSRVVYVCCQRSAPIVL